MMIDNFLKTINEDVAIEGYQRAVSEQIENGLIRDMYMELVGEALDHGGIQGPEPTEDVDKMYESIQDPFEFLEEELNYGNATKDIQRAMDSKAITGNGMAFDRAKIEREQAAQNQGSILWKNRQKMYESEADAELEMFIDPNPVEEGDLCCCGKENCKCDMTNAARPNNGGGIVNKTINLIPDSDPRSVGAYFSDMDDVSVDGSVKESDVSHLIDLIPDTTIVG
jgi:hypothetical protein